MSNNDVLLEAQEVYDRLFKGPEAAVGSLPNYRDTPLNITKPATRRNPTPITTSKSLPCTTILECIDKSEFFNFPTSVGTKTAYIPPYPEPSLPQHTSGDLLSHRATEMETARNNNWYDFSRLPVHFGVHGNMSSPDVILNDYWCVRVDGITQNSPIPPPLAKSKEDNFGVDDTDAGEYEIDLIEPTIRYIEKNWLALLSGYSILDLGPIVRKLEQLVRLLIKIVLDSTPEKVRFEILDPMLAALPIRKPKNDGEADYFPTKTSADSLHYVKPPWDGDFRNDDLMGWLQVAPTSPIYDHFSAYTEHQSNFPISNAIFRRVEGFENDDLDKAMRQNRLFIADYKQFEEACAAGPDAAPYDYGARLYAPIALFALPKISGIKSLKIIAIQPTQDPNSHITTPNDDYWTWQKAKNVVTTISSFSAVIDHLGAHMFMGRMPVGYYRCISNQHPLRALLDTHMMSMVSNNFDGVFNEVGLTLQPGQDPFGNPENGLLSGLFDKISGIGSKHFLKSTLRRASELHFIDDSTPISKKLRKQGDYRKISDHAASDDDIAMPIIYDWVKGYLNLYYKSDTDVSSDTELQDFLSYVANDGGMTGFPASAYSRAEMIDTISRIIYWTSINHSLDRLASHMKLGALGYFGSLPNPKSNSKSTHQDWLNVLPPLNVGLATFSGSRIFVDIPRKWYRSLGKYPEGQFQHDPRIYKQLNKFQRKIKKLDNKLANKNKNRKWAYELRMPSFLTVSPWN